MKNKIKGLLALVLSVLIGQAWAADPVATWTDFNTLTSGNYTITKDAACTVNADGSITLGGAGLSVTMPGNVENITVVMDVSTLPALGPYTIVNLPVTSSANVSLMYKEGKLEQEWGNGGDFGNATWTPGDGRYTIAFAYNKSEGTCTYVDGVHKVVNSGLKTASTSFSSFTIGSYKTDELQSATGMKVYSIRLYGDMFMSANNVGNEIVGSNVIVGSDVKECPITIVGAVTVNAEQTLKTSGYLNFAGSNVINEGGTLDVISGTTTFCAGNRAIKGTVNIKSGATLVASSTDALDYNNTSVFNVYGTLDMSTYRWTLFDGNIFNLYAGCTVTGAGESGRTAWEVCENNTVNILSNGENDSVTIHTPIRLRDSQDILTFNFNEDAAAIVCSIGGVIDGSGKLSVAASGTMELTGANTYAGGTEIAEGATLNVPKMSVLGAANTEVNIAMGGKVTVTSEGNVTEDAGVARAVFAGEGTVEFNGAGYYVLPNNFKAPAYLINNQADNLTIATDGTYDVGSYSGEKYFRMDYNQRGERAFVITQRADATIASDIVQMFGTVSNTERLTDVTVKGVDGATLTLSGAHNNIHFRTLTIDTTGSVNLAGGWKGNVVANGKLAGEGTIGGELTLADGATLAGAVTVIGDVTVDGAVNITHATSAGNTVITCANAEDVAAALTGAPQGLKYVADGNAVKLAAIPVAKIGETPYETLQEAITAAGADATVELCADTTENITIPAGFTATIELGGKTLTGNVKAAYSEATTTDFILQNGYIITPAGNTDKGAIFIKYATVKLIDIDLTAYYHGIRTEVGGNVTIDGGRYEAICKPSTQYNVVYAKEDSTITIEDGTFIRTPNGGAVYCLNSNGADSKIYVKGGSFTTIGSTYLVDLTAKGTCAISGGFFSVAAKNDVNTKLASGYGIEDVVDTAYFTVVEKPAIVPSASIEVSAADAAAAMAKVEILIPEGVTGVDAATYSTYFTKTATLNASTGKYTVTAALNPAVVTPEITAISFDENGNVTVALETELPGLYYAVRSAATVDKVDTDEATVTTGLKAPAVGDAAFYRVLVDFAPIAATPAE